MTNTTHICMTNMILICLVEAAKLFFLFILHGFKTETHFVLESRARTASIPFVYLLNVHKLRKKGISLFSGIKFNSVNKKKRGMMMIQDSVVYFSLLHFLLFSKKPRPKQTKREKGFETFFPVLFFKKDIEREREKDRKRERPGFFFE